MNLLIECRLSLRGAEFRFGCPQRHVDHIRRRAFLNIPGWKKKEKRIRRIERSFFFFFEGEVIKRTRKEREVESLRHADVIQGKSVEGAVEIAYDPVAEGAIRSEPTREDVDDAQAKQLV